MRYFIIICVLSAIEGFYLALQDRFGRNVWQGIQQYRRELAFDRALDRMGVKGTLNRVMAYDRFRIDDEEWWPPDPTLNRSGGFQPAPPRSLPPPDVEPPDELLLRADEIRERLREWK